MNATKFLIAKYVPVVRRMEPRNFGVIVWDGRTVASRFIGSQQPRDDARAPKFIRTTKNREAYCEWVAYWRVLLASGSIKTGRGAVPLTSDGYLEALKRKSRENFMLVDGGEILANEDNEPLNAICDYLFAEVVSEEEDKLLAPPMSLKSRSDAAIKLAFSDLEYKANATLELKLKNAAHTFQWNYGIFQAGNPSAVFQRADASNSSSCNSAAFMLEHVATNPSMKAAALVTGSSLGSREQENIEMLRQYGEVISVDDPAIAALQLRQVAIRV